MKEEKKEKYFYTSSDLAKILTTKLKRRIRASQVNEVAKKLGMTKIYMHDRQTFATYYFVESEFNHIENEL